MAFLLLHRAGCAPALGAMLTMRLAPLAPPAKQPTLLKGRAQDWHSPGLTGRSFSHVLNSCTVKGEFCTGSEVIGKQKFCIPKGPLSDFIQYVVVIFMQ